MRQRPDIEQEVYRILKAARAAIRLKHSLAADDELNEKLPGLEKDVTAALSRGESYELETDSLLR